ncbi:MAG: arsenate reductase [Ectothiorhodospiraceae bacterium]|nr:arsenate reductase [Ectothiorhodospiraceae bacterium]
MTILYGISNCDTCRRARRFLEDAGVTYRFHDLRRDGISAAQVQRWLAVLGSETLVNRRSTTWRALNEAERALATRDQAQALLVAHPTLIKRPILETGDTLHAGFREADFRKLLGLEGA